MRITSKHLEGLVCRLNTLTNNPVGQYTILPGGKYQANVGNYHLDGAYGGWSLRQVVNKSGGESDIFNSGYCTKKALYDMIHAYIRGIEAQWLINSKQEEKCL